MKKFIFSLITICISVVFNPCLSIAQTDAGDGTEQFGDDIRFPMLPYYSYGSGLGWTTPDSTFRLNLRFRMQNRATYTDTGDNEAIEAAVRRLRVRFDGFVGDTRFLYAIQLSFAPDDVGEIIAGENINIIRDAVFFYQPNNYWSFGFGQTKLPGNRQRVNSSGALQLTDRSINNARFNIDRDFGLFVYHLNEVQNRFSYNIKTAMSTGDGRNTTHNTDTNLAYTARIELFPLGAFQNNGWIFEGDLLREQTPKLMISGTYHYNTGAQRQRGQLGPNLFESRDLRSILLDAIIKYRGFSAMAAYMSRDTDNPVTINPVNPDDFSYVFSGNGTDFQVSYLFPVNVEIIGRFSNQLPQNSLRGIYPHIRQYTFGITKYIWEHALKLQSEFTYSREEFLQTAGRNQWYMRFQMEIGI